MLCFRLILLCVGGNWFSFCSSSAAWAIVRGSEILFLNVFCDKQRYLQANLIVALNWILRCKGVLSSTSLKQWRILFLSWICRISGSTFRTFSCLIFLTGWWARCKTAYLVQHKLMKSWNPFYVLTDAPVVLNLMTITAGLESLLLHQVQSGTWSKKIKTMHSFKVICKNSYFDSASPFTIYYLQWKSFEFLGESMKVSSISNLSCGLKGFLVLILMITYAMNAIV